MLPMQGNSRLRSSILWVGLAFLVPSLCLVGWKAFVLGVPLSPSPGAEIWRIEREINVRGNGPGSVSLAIPSSEPGQLVSDGHAGSDRLSFAIRSTPTGRRAVWTGELLGVHRLVHGFRAQLSEVRAMPDPDAARTPEPGLYERHCSSTGRVPAEAAEIARLLDVLWLTPGEDPVASARALFTFVTDEVELARSATDDALLTLATREGSELGQARLLATSLCACRIPARLVTGLRVRRDGEVREAEWVEAWLGRWVTLSPSRAVFGRRPAEWIVVQRATDDVLQVTGVESASLRTQALRERLRPEELAAVMQPSSPLLAQLSLYRLPVRTQRILRLLLLIPLGALILAVLRNVVGIQTFGTFLPILVALALRESDLATGVVMLAGVLAVGTLARLGLQRLHLLLVPRLCLILCIVVLLLLGLSVLGHEVESPGLLGGVLFPIVILSMLIERFSIAVAEEGWTNAATRLGWTAAAVLVLTPLFKSDVAAHLMFGFPELVLAVMGVLVWIGGYTGYRLSEWLRFRPITASLKEGA